MGDLHACITHARPPPACPPAPPPRAVQWCGHQCSGLWGVTEEVHRAGDEGGVAGGVRRAGGGSAGRGPRYRGKIGKEGTDPPTPKSSGYIGLTRE